MKTHTHTQKHPCFTSDSNHQIMLHPFFLLPSREPQDATTSMLYCRYSVLGTINSDLSTVGIRIYKVHSGKAQMSHNIFLEKWDFPNEPQLVKSLSHSHNDHSLPSNPVTTAIVHLVACLTSFLLVFSFRWRDSQIPRRVLVVPNTCHFFLMDVTVLLRIDNAFDIFVSILRFV